MMNVGVFSDFDIVSLHPSSDTCVQLGERLSQVDKFIRECHKNMSRKGAKNRRRAILKVALKRFYKNYKMDQATRSMMIKFILDKEYYYTSCRCMKILRLKKWRNYYEM